jgi:hypothetical protein
MERFPDVVGVLDNEGPIQPQLVPDPVGGFRVGVLTHHHQHRIAWPVQTQGERDKTNNQQQKGQPQ